MSILSPMRWAFSEKTDNFGESTQLFLPAGSPTGKLIVLGEAPLMGAMTGSFAVEVCSAEKDGANKYAQAEGAGAFHCRLWTIYDGSDQIVVNRVHQSLSEPSKPSGAALIATDHLPLPRLSHPPTYSRICTNAPTAVAASSLRAHATHATQIAKHLQFWIDPQDALANIAGLSSQWLEPLNSRLCGGLILTQLNVHMLSGKGMLDLCAAGLWCERKSLATSRSADFTGFNQSTSSHRLKSKAQSLEPRNQSKQA